jgi:DNA-directed RNA polymerase subunit alpha
MRPEEAMRHAAQILINHLRIVAGVKEDDLLPPEEEKEEEEEGGLPREIYETPIEQLDLSVRVFNSLKRTGITSVGEVLEMLERGPDAMLAIRNFGEKSLDELIERLREKDFMTEEVEMTVMMDE